MQQEISKLAMNHNQPDNKNHSVIYCKQTIWVSEKKSVCSFIYPLATISIPLWFHLFLRIVLRHSGRSETFVAELQYQIAVLNLSVLKSRRVSFQMPKKVFIISNFSTLCWSVPEGNFIFLTNAKVTWKY